MRIKKWNGMCVLLCILLAVAACDGTGEDVNPNVDGSPAAVRRVTVSPEPAHAVKGDSLQFTAVVEGEGGAAVGQAVTWTVLQQNRHADTQIDASGLLAVASGETADFLTVQAVSVQNSQKSARATVTVLGEPAILSVTVEPSETAVAQGLTRQFAALVAVAGTLPKTVTWSLTGATAAGTFISSTGLLTVAGNEPIGSSRLTVTAAAVEDSQKKDTAAVSIEANIPLPTLVGTVWRWGDRAQGSITVQEWQVDRTDADGVHHGTVRCYRPLDPAQQVYIDWFYYDPATKTGEIEYINKFYITPSNSHLMLPQYAQYPHGAVFARVVED